MAHSILLEDEAGSTNEVKERLAQWPRLHQDTLDKYKSLVRAS
jgi:hypothetical protein